MNKFDLIKKIENFAPPETQERWDCSGWVVETDKTDVKRVMIALTPTPDVYNQAKTNNCDMIISHHPMFYVPLNFSDMDIYCAHTNMDKANGGTTDVLAQALDLKTVSDGEFLRIAELEISIKDLSEKIKKISPSARLINNQNVEKVSKIGLCAGSGMDLYRDALQQGCDCFITGDLKYHTAVDCEKVVYDVGHFESEILIKKVFQCLIEDKVEVIIANEKSPFKNI